MCTGQNQIGMRAASAGPHAKRLVAQWREAVRRGAAGHEVLFLSMRLRQTAALAVERVYVPAGCLSQQLGQPALQTVSDQEQSRL